MAEIRAWLDSHRIEPSLVQISFHPGRETRFRLTFQNASEAAAFAQAFDLEVLSSDNAGGIAA